MGELGQPARYLATLLGSEWTYVCEDAEVPRAPGQFSLKEARSLGQPSSETPFFGIIGRPVRHSLSPALHNGLFRHYGLPGSYIRLPLDRLDPWFDYLAKSSLGFQGFSVTLPFKTDIVSLLPASRLAGPVGEYPGGGSPQMGRLEHRLPGLPCSAALQS